MGKFGGRCVLHREIATPERFVVAAEGSTSKASNGIEPKEISSRLRSAPRALRGPSALRDFRLSTLQKRKIKDLLGPDLARHAGESFAALNNDAL